MPDDVEPPLFDDNWQAAMNAVGALTACQSRFFALWLNQLNSEVASVVPVSSEQRDEFLQRLHDAYEMAVGRGD